MSDELRAAIVGVIGTLLGTLFGAALGAFGTYIINHLAAKRDRAWKLEDEERQHFRKRREEVLTVVEEFIISAMNFVSLHEQLRPDLHSSALLPLIQQRLDELRTVSAKASSAIVMLGESEASKQLEEFNYHVALCVWPTR